MAILSWLRSKRHFIKRNPIDEFREYTEEEARRLRNSDSPFDEDSYRKAVALVLQKLDTRYKKV